jgi:hypothetical protein
MAPTYGARTVMATVAFLTMSYGSDRDRSALLCRNMREFAPSAEHWIVVDRADLELFKSLRDARTTLLTTEELLPVWLRRLNLHSGQYLTPASLCHDYRTSSRLSDDELTAFLDGVGTDEVGVSITAKAGMQPSDYVEAFEQRWAAVRQ